MLVIQELAEAEALEAMEQMAELQLAAQQELVTYLILQEQTECLVLEAEAANLIIIMAQAIQRELEEHTATEDSIAITVITDQIHMANMEEVEW